MSTSAKPSGSRVVAAQHGERHRQILNREPGRVEDGDLLGAAAALGGSVEHRTELGHGLAREGARLDGVHELAVVARLLPVVAEDANARQLLDCDLGFPGAVRAHQAHVLAGPERAGTVDELVARRHRRHQVGSQRFLATRSDRGTQVVGRNAGTLRVDVPEQRLVSASHERAGRRPPVDARPDHGSALCIRPPERLRRQDGGGAGPQRGDRAGVQGGPQHPVRGVGDEHDPAHCRQPLLRVAREGRDPLEQCVPAAERRHRPEVTGGVGRDVDLRRHRPLAPGVRDEGCANRLDRGLGRDGRLDVAGREERYGGQAPRRP